MLFNFLDFSFSHTKVELLGALLAAAKARIAHNKWIQRQQVLLCIYGFFGQHPLESQLVNPLFCVCLSMQQYLKK
jgi:hypothetical protein